LPRFWFLNTYFYKHYAGYFTYVDLAVQEANAYVRNSSRGGGYRPEFADAQTILVRSIAFARQL
jgi:hypothetical protein